MLDVWLLQWTIFQKLFFSLYIQIKHDRKEYNTRDWCQYRILAAINSFLQQKKKSANAVESFIELDEELMEVDDDFQ